MNSLALAPLLLSACEKAPTYQEAPMLTGDCIAPGETLDGEQFPMLRGVEHVATLPDGSCIEKVRHEQGHEIIYVIHGNEKLKLVGQQRGTAKAVLADLDDFEAVQNWAIENLENSYETLTVFPNTLFEGPIDECPEWRYRRGYSRIDFKAHMATDCIWNTPDDRHCPATNSRTLVMLPNEEPTPTQWLGTQPNCPGEGQRYPSSLPDSTVLEFQDDFITQKLSASKDAKRLTISGLNANQTEQILRFEDFDELKRIAAQWTLYSDLNLELEEPISDCPDYMYRHSLEMDKNLIKDREDLWIFGEKDNYIHMKTNATVVDPSQKEHYVDWFLTQPDCPKN